MDRRQIGRSLKNFGIRKTLQDLGLRALNRVLFYKILKGVTISGPDPESASCAGDYCGMFLDHGLLLRFSADPQNELPPEFVREALGRGDRCYGFLAGDALASYGWYSRRPTAIDPPELTLHFDEQYVYMYKGFTHPDHRGKRLHAAGMTRALIAYLTEGCNGIVSYVEWNNFASLQSCYRMGYSDFGTIRVMRLFGRYFCSSDAGCERYGFRLEERKPEYHPHVVTEAA